MKSDILIKIPDGARYIIESIQAAGYEAYVVGGCVRDCVLGREPQDWDITTSARPEQVKELFDHTIDTGLQHGTVTVMQNRTGYEVTTYRIDGKYEDSRHPKEVAFTPDLREDLRRRDFTVNAMAYNDEAGLVDIFGGMEDIRNGVIRCVGNAAERFGEDALRMLRAIRFSAQLDYRIDEQAQEGIRRLAPTLRNISAERIQAELVKILTSPHPDRLREAYRLGITEIFLPEFDRAMETEQNHPHHRFSVGEHILHSLSEARPDKILRLAMLLHDIGKPAVRTTDEAGITHFHGHAAVSADMAKQILRRLKFDNDTIAMVSRLVMYHDYGHDIDPTMRVLRHAINRIGEDAFPMLFEVKYADICAQSDYLRREKLERLEAWKRMYAEVIRQKQCVTLKELAVSGSDLIAAGMKPGREMGDVLQKLLELVLEEPSLNTREELMERALKMICNCSEPCRFI